MVKKYKPLYEIFKDEELQIAEKIQQRRLQMLIHSRLYYIENQNIISDYKWSEWAQELRQLQDSNPKIAKKVAWSKEFENWDGSSGTFLPLDNEWVRSKAEYIKIQILLVKNKDDSYNQIKRFRRGYVCDNEY